MTEARDTTTAQKMMKEVLANRPEGEEKQTSLLGLHRVTISFGAGEKATEVLGYRGSGLPRVWE